MTPCDCMRWQDEVCGDACTRGVLSTVSVLCLRACYMFVDDSQHKQLMTKHIVTSSVFAHCSCSTMHACDHTCAHHVTLIAACRSHMQDLKEITEEVLYENYRIETVRHARMHACSCNSMSIKSAWCAQLGSGEGTPQGTKHV